MLNFQSLDFQSEFYKRLFVETTVVPFEIPLVWKTIATCDQEILELVLGDAGCHLHKLTEIVDLEHPDITSIFEGKLNNDQPFVQEFIEIIKLAEIAKGNNLCNILPRVSKTIIQDANNTLQLINTHSKNRTNVRFLKDKKDRNHLRLQKKMQFIDLKNLYKKGSDFWESLPDSFIKFIRFDNAYQEDFILAEKKAKQYEELGCTSLADEIKKAVATFKLNMEQSYFGFNRITLTNASAILAKSLGFKLFSFCNNWDSFDRETHAVLSKNELKLEPKFVTLEKDLSAEFLSCDDQYYFYEPRIYPYHVFEELASDETKQIVNFLESFPEANGKPIFDHFGVIVSGVKYFKNKSKRTNFSVKLENQAVETFCQTDDFVCFLDKKFIQKKIYSAIIVAEKDGKTYFICYFT